MGGLIILAIVAVLAGPVLGILALVAVRRLENASQNHLLPQITSRIFALEKTVVELERVAIRGPAVRAEPDNGDQAGESLPATTPSAEAPVSARLPHPPS